MSSNTSPAASAPTDGEPKVPAFNYFDPTDFVEDMKCTTCKVIGSAAFMGLGAYTYLSGMKQLELKKKQIAMSDTRWGIGIRRLGVTGMAGTLFLLGIYRATMTT